MSMISGEKGEVMVHPWSMGGKGKIDEWKEIGSESTSLFLMPGEA
jgi:hypothetical protein